MHDNNFSFVRLQYFPEITVVTKLQGMKEKINEKYLKIYSE